MASINFNGTIIQSSFPFSCCGKLYLLDAITIATFENKFSEVRLIVIDVISKVPKKVIYRIHQRLIEIFNLPDKPFDGKSVLAVGELYQLPSVNVKPMYACAFNFTQPTAFI